MATYHIVRMYFTRHSRRVNGMSGLTLEEAKEHCKDPETSSKTCTSSEGRRRTRECGPWFDAYEED